MRIESLKDNPQFIETVAGWLFKEFIENVKHDTTYEMVCEKLKNRNKDTIPCTLVAIDKNVCVGVVSLYSNDLKERNDLTPWLAALFVSKEHRKKGVARKLIEEITAIAKKLGYDKLYLRTEHASGYYKKLGWQSIYKTIDEYNQATEVFMKEIL